jgi:DNA topoisomerase-6 subunit B
VVQDNGPGIVKAQVPKIFGKLLYGSKFHRLKQSLTGDQMVLIEREGTVERLPIGRLVDPLLTDGEDVKDVSDLEIRVPAFDPKTWRYAWRPLSHVIRHERANEILEVRTERGKSVRVTGCHSLFTYDANSRQVQPVEARTLRPGDYIVAPRRVPESETIDPPFPTDKRVAARASAGTFMGTPSRVSYRLADVGSLAIADESYAATTSIEDMRSEIGAVRSIAASDLCLLCVVDVRQVQSQDPYVYDLSVPGCENFVAGEGLLACHNSRGQQGIGISAAAMYGQLTTGKPIRVTSRVGKKKSAHVFDIQLDTRKNEPVVIHDDTREEWQLDHGTRVELEIVANWQQGQRFVNRYVEHTALANPHASIHYTRPVSAAQRSDPNVDQPGNETLTFPRAANELPKEAVEIRPHPHGVELGALMLMAQESKSHDVRGFLQSTFSRVSAQAAGEILSKVAWGKKPPRPRVLGANRAMAEELHKAIAATKLMSPPTNCLSPIGDELMRKGLVSFLNVIESEGESADENAQLDLDSAGMKTARKTAKAAKAAKPQAAAPVEQPAVPDAPPEEGVEKIKGHNYFIATVTRSPKVYRGNPFQIEVGLAYGGSWPPDKTIELFRFANRVPLLFQRGACGITDAIVRTDWRNYLLSQPKGSLPVGPMALLVHIASVWVPFTSESKEAVAHYPEITKEIQLAAQECGRKLATFIRKRKAADYQAQRRSIFELYIEEVAAAIGKITGRKPDPIKREFLQVAHKVTAAEMKEEQKEMEAAAREAKQKAKARAEAEEE